MNSTCIHYEGSRPGYIHVHVLKNMHKTPYTMGKLQKIHIHLTAPPQTQGGSMTLSLERWNLC